jgi:hypothetical protein
LEEENIWHCYRKYRTILLRQRNVALLPLGKYKTAGRSKRTALLRDSMLSLSSFLKKQNCIAADKYNAFDIQLDIGTAEKKKKIKNTKASSISTMP